MTSPRHTATSQPPRGISIRWLLTGVILATSLLVLIVGFWVMTNRNIQTLRQSLEESTFQTARFVGESTLADLVFGTREDAVRTLSNLRHDPNVVAAALYDDAGGLFATYQSAARVAQGAIREDLRFGVPEPFMTGGDGYVEVFLPLEEKGERFGTIFLRSSTELLDERISEYIFTVTMFCSGLLAMSFIVALLFQRVVSAPILRLAQVAERLSTTEDYTVRVPRGGAREVNILARSLNRMLAALEQRQRARLAAEAAQKRYDDRLRVLREIDRAILVGGSLEEVALMALESLARVVKSSGAEVMEFDDDHERARAIASAPAGAPGEGRVESLAEEGAFLDEIRWGATWVKEDTRSTDRLPGLFKVFASGGGRSLICFPLVADGRLLGTLALRWEVQGLPHDDDRETAQEVAGLLALSIRQARLTRALERHAEDLEMRVAERTAQLEASNRELEAFGYSVAHDLRAPLRSIRNFSDALQEDCSGRLDDAGRDLLQRIVTAGKRMDTLIVDLLEYSRLSAKITELSTVDLSPVVWEVRAQLAGQLAERGAVIAVADPLGRVIGHRVTLVQVLSNIVSNAIKFVEAGSRPVVRIWSREGDGMVRLWVEDNGIGIEEQNIHRIFRLFDRLHGQGTYPGTGVGLALVKKGVERMAGRFGVESEPGKGSRFWIELRKATDEPSTEEIRIRDLWGGR